VRTVFPRGTVERSDVTTRRRRHGRIILLSFLLLLAAVVLGARWYFSGPRLAHFLTRVLFEGKIRAVVSTLDARSKGVTTQSVVIKPGQMKLFYVLDGTVALHYNGERHLLETGDSALLDGGTAHGWENLGGKKARVLWVILG